MRHSELTRCPACGAPLTAPPDPTVHHLVTCTFCKAQITVEPDQVAAPPMAPAPFYGAPPPFGAPPQYGPPIQPMMPPTFAPRIAASTRVRVNPIGIILPIIMLAVFAVPAVLATRGGFSGLLRSFSSDPFPIKCGLNETIELDGKTSNRTDTLIDATQNCKVRISNSKLKGATIVRAQHNAEVTIVKSNLESSGDAIDCGFNAKIRLENASVIKAGGSGIRAGANGDVQVLGGSRIESQGTAVQIDVNGVLNVQNSTVQGKVAFDFDTNGKVRLVNSKAIGARKLGMNGRVDE